MRQFYLNFIQNESFHQYNDRICVYSVFYWSKKKLKKKKLIQTHSNTQAENIFFYIYIQHAACVTVKK